MTHTTAPHRRGFVLALLLGPSPRPRLPAVVEARPAPAGPPALPAIARAIPAPGRQIQLYRRPRPPARQAEDVYPEHSTSLAMLRRAGVTEVYGVHDARAWATSTSAAQLYRVPVGRGMRANLADVFAEMARRSGSDHAWPNEHSLTPRDVAGIAIVDKAHALRLMFPGYGEGTGRAVVSVDLPEMPDALHEMTVRARLAGFEIGAAAPAEAIALRDIQRDAPGPDADPIVYAQRGDAVFVLGQYGACEGRELTALVRVLLSMRCGL